MTVQKWERRDQETIADMRIFKLSRLVARSPRTGKDRDVALVQTGDWVNIIALTGDRRVILVEQYRHGSDEITLEIPGGLIDTGEGPEQAALRELREETGYTGATVSEIGTVRPNPAFIDNRCYTYLVEGCQRTAELELDDGEDIEVRSLPLEEIPAAIEDGRIDHALVICGFWWLTLRRPDLLRLSEGQV